MIISLILMSRLLLLARTATSTTTTQTKVLILRRRRRLMIRIIVHLILSGSLIRWTIAIPFILAHVDRHSLRSSVVRQLLKPFILNFSLIFVPIFFLALHVLPKLRILLSPIEFAKLWHLRILQIRIIIIILRVLKLRRRIRPIVNLREILNVVDIQILLILRIPWLGRRLIIHIIAAISRVLMIPAIILGEAHIAVHIIIHRRTLRSIIVKLFDHHGSFLLHASHATRLFRWHEPLGKA